MGEYILMLVYQIEAIIFSKVVLQKIHSILFICPRVFRFKKLFFYHSVK